VDPVTEISRAAFGRAVAGRRAELRLTQEALSLRSGLHQKWLSNVETARINPTLSNLARLAASLEIPLSELIARAEVIDRERRPPAGVRESKPLAKPRRRKPPRGLLAPAETTAGSG
jgi:transcriptional regulator with XRE-family HTH domain